MFTGTKTFGRALLAYKASHLCHRHSGDPQLAQGISDFLELVWLDDGFDFLHAGLFSVAWPLALGMPHAKDLLWTAKTPAFTGGFAQKGILKGLFIGGTFVEPLSGIHFATENPATEQPIAEIAEADASD